MTRWKAAAVHLSISAAIGLVAAALIFGLWYPPPYSHAAGADELVILLLGVDLVLGPLLTLAVFKSGKRGMKFDLAVIALLQACAFFYGASVVVRARPAFIVAAVDRFVLVSANDLDPADLALAKPGFDRLPWTGPRLAGAELPTDPKARTDLMFNSLGGRDIEKLPQHYVDYSAVAAHLLTRAQPLAHLQKAHPAAAARIETWLRDHGRDAASVVWLPIVARTDMTMLLDPHTGSPLGALPIDPW